MRWRLVTLRILTLLILLILVSRLAQLQLIEGNTFRSRAVENTIRTDYVLPVRGEIYASDGKTLLAASVPIFNVVVRPDTLPAGEDERQEVFSSLASLLALTDTLTISPATALIHQPQLARDLRRIVGPQFTAALVPTDAQALTITLPYSQNLAGLHLSRTYSDVVQYHSSVEQIMYSSDLPPYLPIPIKTEIPREVALVLRENQSAFPGFQVIQSYRRGYPLSAELPSLSHLLGFLGRIDPDELKAANPPSESDSLPNYLLNDLIGKAGLEASYEDDLRGTLGVRQIEVDVNQVPVGEPLILRPAVGGHNLVLSIDIDLQRHAEATLKKWIEEADRRRQRLHPDYAPINKGVIVVIDVNTGAILASVSLPAYDNNVLTRPLSQNDVEFLFQNPDKPMINRVIADWYPPGSTFKQVSAAAALGYGLIQPDTRVHDPGYLLLANEYDPSTKYVFPNSIRGDRGMINVVDGLKNSSNVFFQQIIGGTRYVLNLRPNDPKNDDGLGVERLAEVANNWFGLGQPTGIDLPGEIEGFIPTRQWREEVKHEIWSVGDTYNMAIGQGYLLLTPLQVLQITATIANGGTRYQPHVVKAVTTIDGQVVRHNEPVVTGQLPLDDSLLAVIREGMYRSVQDADAYNNRVASPEQRALYQQLQLAGKTGTAEYIEPNGRKRSHAWFVGFAPYDNPQIAALAFLEGTGDLADGSGTLTLPAVAEVMAAYFGIAQPAVPQEQKRP